MAVKITELIHIEAGCSTKLYMFQRSENICICIVTLYCYNNLFKIKTKESKQKKVQQL